MKIDLNFVAQAIKAHIIMPEGAAVNGCFSGIAHDSRLLKPGDLFVALRGANGDGHHYLDQAAAKGAAAVMVEQGFEPRPQLSLPVIEVRDTLSALQQLAHAWRMEFELPLIAVTGSVGKTSTKDMLAACLQPLGPVLKTQGNFNNEIGLPITLLNLDAACRNAVVEMGMRAPGEISALAAIARPSHAVISNVEAVHLESMGSIQNIARAKAEILDYIEEGGFALINGDQQLLREAAAGHKAKLYRFGWAEDCEMRILQTRCDAEGLAVRMELLGEAMLLALPLPVPELAYNMAAAAGTARLLGVSCADIKTALAGITLSKLRMHIIELPEGGVVINDTYNASPPSMKAALGLLHQIAGSRAKVAVLGDMLELGSYEREGHREVGDRAALLGVRTLLTVGRRAADIAEGACRSGMDPESIYRFADAGACLLWMREHISRGDAVLFKASRGMKLEELMEGWLCPSPTGEKL
ncbi:MAG: UDP-N-acetylmuramoyl-tripeptide--D-alanyl-D-alanine ligase [Syntrophomonadaceae bacterium]|nr:UDP-N-acetylmuramoyl-tripeptide--D-alanyl-D-alanine ligase [Syntrophomonadaceae bacterium]